MNFAQMLMKGPMIRRERPVVLVHHSGKDSSKGARGWSGLRAAAVVKRVTTEYDPAEEAAEGENPEHIDVAIELQITDLEVAGQRPDVATILYG